MFCLQDSIKYHGTTNKTSPQDGIESFEVSPLQKTRKGYSTLSFKEFPRRFEPGCTQSPETGTFYIAAPFYEASMIVVDELTNLMHAFNQMIDTAVPKK